jgi:hypothetical protein
VIINNGMNETWVKDWNELIESLFEGAWQPELLRYRSPFAFRGMTDANQLLDTTLIRLGGKYAEMEGHLLRNFRKYARPSNVEVDSLWNWLSLAKHHGLPTRLLDWSFSPLVALHFATSKIHKFHLDGVIWMVDYTQVHQRVPEVLRRHLAEEGADVFTVEMLQAEADTLKDFEALSGEEYALFFEPPSMDERIVNQFALFSLMSAPQGLLNEWLEHRPQMFRKIMIPSALKWEIRDKLDQLNITERVLFPGLDGLSAWLQRQYTQRHPPRENDHAG